ncbi:hypothetical protein INT45_013210 [Circinella minor]|uniref:Uncharacterized protein n=1 Tax=Circinella minor TaxID=1195481 RepID=A0A8H7RYL3_9FUNG|nr:hypothetical protein INT45_013210 [Circinella minor]
MSYNTRSPPLPVASTSTDTIHSHQSSTLGTGNGYNNEHLLMKKIELTKLNSEEIKIIQLFRPGVLRDPSYRRISLSAVEYMKDVKEQMIDDIKHQALYAIEPPDTDAEQINNNSHFMDENHQLVPRRKIAHTFLYRANPNADDSVNTSPTDSAGNNLDPISNYNDLIQMAGEPRHRKVLVSKLKDFDLEPLFDHVRRIESKPSVFTCLQDTMVFIRGLEPPAPPRQSGTNTTGKSNSPLSSSSTSPRRFSISLRRRIMEESNISANELSDQHRLQWASWERNLMWFIHTANILMGNFHGHLPYHWLNPYQLERDWQEGPEVRKLPRIPTLEEFDRSRYSISAFPRIKYGIKVIGKEVSLQVLSLLDFRYRIEDKTILLENPTIWRYYSDSILKLSKLIPNKRSFDVAVDVGMIPEDMKSMVDFTWWTNNVIKFGREIERMPASSEGGGIIIGKETYELFDELHKGYYSFVKTVRRDTGEQLKYNPVQFILNIIMAILTLAGVVFAITGIIQMLQGFCVFGTDYCNAGGE